MEYEIDENKIKTIYMKKGYDIWEYNLVKYIPPKGAVYIGAGCSVIRIEPYVLNYLCFQPEGNFQSTYFIDELQAHEHLKSIIEGKLKHIEKDIEELKNTTK